MLVCSVNTEDIETVHIHSHVPSFNMAQYFMLHPPACPTNGRKSPQQKQLPVTRH